MKTKSIDQIIIEFNKDEQKLDIFNEEIYYDYLIEYIRENYRLVEK